MINQRERILQYLRDEGSITRAEAFAELGIVELPARICELERLGFEFKKEVIRKKNRYGDRIRFMKYTLKDKDEEI